MASEYTLIHTGAEVDNSVSYTKLLTVSTTELNYVKGVTGAVQTQLNAKESLDNVVSKGDTTVPVFFDENGVATAITSYSGNAATATKATQDADGSVITATYARKSSRSIYVLNKDSWVFDTASGKYKYDLENAGYNLLVELASSADDAAYKAYVKAKITGHTTENKLTALGKKPEVNIPIILTKEEK